MLSCGIDLFCCYDGSTDCCSDGNNIFDLGTTSNITTIGYPAASPTQSLIFPALPGTSSLLPASATSSASSVTTSSASSAQPESQSTSPSMSQITFQSAPQPTSQSMSQSSPQAASQMTSQTTSQITSQITSQTVSSVSASVTPSSTAFRLAAKYSPYTAMPLSAIAAMLAYLLFI